MHTSTGLNDSQSFQDRLARIRASDSYVDIAPLAERPDPVKARKDRTDRTIAWETFGYFGVLLLGICAGILCKVLLAMPVWAPVEAKTLAQDVGNLYLWAYMAQALGPMSAALPFVLSYLLGWRTKTHLVLAGATGYVMYHMAGFVIDLCQQAIYLVIG
ncbi:hypothetical protein [Tropicibacter naphthalenivorans]|uniref:Uncharacterized protein n=1 Tax=Tropicibacter naphthalenivorans TaxID=441103 RepID=A0A0P1G5A2_9RHOB|nr:hypothetical protein [Tropicibacter naphthalenivorans]CUH76791.1 hypothetical protein TRN7648_01127 [Tropicibacter naphthalenivorans]SMC62964.1 hypothetical protein SAMN04488093_102491 [Tropicibacter naphthalenivorans]